MVQSKLTELTTKWESQFAAVSGHSMILDGKWIGQVANSYFFYVALLVFIFIWKPQFDILRNNLISFIAKTQKTGDNSQQDFVSFGQSF